MTSTCSARSSTTIGDTLSPYNHPDIAAAIVKPFVSEANYFMVKHHGEFQGYYFWDLHWSSTPTLATSTATARTSKRTARILWRVRPNRLQRELRQQPA